MSDLSPIFSVSISVQDSAVTRTGFGTPLIASAHTFWPERVRSFADRQEALDAGMVSGSRTDQVLTALLSADTRVSEVKIGNRRNVPTQSLQLTPTNTTTGFVYFFEITAPGSLTSTPITYTVLALDVVADITAALTPLITAISGITATDNGTDVSFDVDTPGDIMDLSGWIQPEDRGALIFADITADPGLLTDLDAIEAFDPDWYGLLLDSSSKAEAVVAAAFISTKSKMFGFQNSDTEILNPVVTTDVFSVIQALTNNRAVGHYTQVSLLNPLAAARFGERLPTDPASGTWKFKKGSGSSADDLKSGEITAIEAKGGEVFIRLRGNNFFQQGRALGGRFLDLTRGVDELAIRIQENLFSLFLNNDAVRFTSSGIGLVKGNVLATLNSKVGVDKLLAANPPPSVTAPLPEDISQNDKATRVLNEVRFAAKAGGAIHFVNIQGTISL